ncbi:hypothetical protein ACFVT5_29465 [Streptomyces sp. NPDC058001]|uniref:hypothetical protein n=1 Tax=Streptomyces sp. NPDC058001 TaxID=3346300 RepID=UPI0036E2BECC
MWIWIVMAVLLVGATATAVDKARKGQWWAAGGVLLPNLGVLVMFRGLERESMSLFWLFCLLVVAGYGAEGMAYWRNRTRASEPLNPESGNATS